MPSQEDSGDINMNLSTVLVTTLILQGLFVYEAS